MNFDLLKTELAKPAYAELSDEEAVATLNEKSITKVVMRFGSFRTLANVLDDAEYATLRTVLAAAGQANPRVADMVKMLELPGDEGGSGGGIDFGSSGVRGMLDYFVSQNMISAAIAEKMKAPAETLVSVADELGLPAVQLSDVAVARGTRNLVQKEGV